jgi:hypothetical protein
VPRAIAQPPPPKRSARADTPRVLASLALIVLAALAVTACGSGGSKTSASSRTVLAVERSDLLLVARALRGAEASVQHEVTASKRVWTAIAHGLPGEISASLQLDASTANTAASDIQAPSFMTQAEGPTAKPRRELTGPAAGIAGLFQSFSVLSEHGWKLIAATIEGAGHSSTTTAQFLRANAPLYIASIYDGHFDLASIGKNLLKAYRKLGGSSGFGDSLQAGEVDMLTRFYGDRLRLEPHVVSHML